MRKWFLDNSIPIAVFIIGVIAIVVAIGSTVVAARILDTNKEEPVPQVVPIGYTLYNVSTNTIIDVMPCPHSWRLAPDWYSTNQWMPEF